MKEEWRTIEEFPDYEVSNFGEIRRKYKKDCWGKHYKLVLRPNHWGYLKVTLQVKNKRYTKFVHKFVLKAFKPKHSVEKNQCNHIDGNKLNNNLNNLEWCTNSENQKHAIKLGLAKRPKGKDHPNSILTEEIVKRIKTLVNNRVSKQKVRQYFNISSPHLSGVLRETIWKHVKI